VVGKTAQGELNLSDRIHYMELSPYYEEKTTSHGTNRGNSDLFFIAQSTMNRTLLYRTARDSHLLMAGDCTQKTVIVPNKTRYLYKIIPLN
jgi:hypothetical protein